MDHFLLNAFCAGYVIVFGLSFLFFDRLLRMESLARENQRHHGGRAVSIFSMARDTGHSHPQWSDVKALVLGLRLYVIWLFRMPLWVRSDPRACRALWTMRSLFWLCIVGMYIVREILL